LPERSATPHLPFAETWPGSALTAETWRIVGDAATAALGAIYPGRAYIDAPAIGD